METNTLRLPPRVTAARNCHTEPRDVGAMLVRQPPRVTDSARYTPARAVHGLEVPRCGSRGDGLSQRRNFSAEREQKLPYGAAS